MDYTFLFVSLVDQFAYGAIFLLLLCSGYFFPIPEEVILFITGYMVSAGLIKVMPSIIISIFAIIIGDNILFHLAKVGSKFVIRFVNRFFIKGFMRDKDYVSHHISRIIFFSRFIPFLRMAGPSIAGTLNVPWKKFFILNTLAVMIYVPIIFFLGYNLDSYFNYLFLNPKNLFFLIFILVILFILIFYRNKIARKFLQNKDKSI
ncbi:MAG: VTT domain-containing protein [Minisyncoccia bacterium]